jgi:hypothetical protein
VAEELDADWTLVRVESAPADAKRYANLAFGTIREPAAVRRWPTPGISCAKRAARPARCC